MISTKTQKTLIIVFYCVGAACLIAGALWDKQISKLIYTPDSCFAEFFKRIGEFPPYVSIPFFGVVFFYGNPKNIGKTLTVIWRILFGAVCLGGFIFIMTKFGDYWIVDDDFRLSYEIVFAVILTAPTLWFGKYIPKKYLKPLKKFSFFCVIVFAVTALGVDGLKTVWGRTRPHDMLKNKDFSDFSPWYLPQGNTGHHSFPSGHANQSALLFMITALPDVFSSLKKRETAFFVISWLFTAVVSVSRMMLGAHFLSDVTAGILITFTAVYIIRYFMFRKDRLSA